MVAARKSASAASTPASALAQLEQETELKIIAITEPLKPKDVLQSSSKRNSGASVDEDDQNFDTHPASLEADLKHYKVRMHCNLTKHKTDSDTRSFSVSCASPT